MIYSTSQPWTRFTDIKTFEQFVYLFIEGSKQRRKITYRKCTFILCYF